MLYGFLQLHNFLRWFALLAILIALIRSFKGMRKGIPYTQPDNLWALLTLIAFHTQLIVGFVLFFGNGWYLRFGEMAVKAIRFFTVEHTLGMLIAIALVTIGRVKSKKEITDIGKHKKIFWFFFIALIITLASIPWPFREAIGRPWLPALG